MTTPRETIFAALFERLRVVAGFVTTSRQLKSFDDTPPSECPAMFLTKGPEISVTQQSMPLTRKLMADLTIYVRNDADPDAAASTVINQLLDAIDAALEYSPTEGQTVGAPFVANPYAGIGTTLGGLVSYCRIAGTVEVYEGTISDGATVIVPIELLAVS